MSEMFHYGTPRRSGRYPWGSGEDPMQNNTSFLGYVRQLEKEGLSQVEIARAMGLKSTTQLRAKKSIAKDEKRASDVSMVYRLKEKGLSNVAIGERMGINESSVRSLLNESIQAKTDQTKIVANLLRDKVDGEHYIDVGLGVERYVGVSKEKLATAVSMLEEEGYRVHNFKFEQLGTGKETQMKVLTPPDTEWVEVVNNKHRVGLVNAYTDDKGTNFKDIQPPVDFSSKRLAVRLKEDGGGDMDGVIELRRGVDDIALGGSKYAQVRIAVDGTHYLKGMAMYSDDLPPGIDMRFNTKKTKAEAPNKLDALKPIKDDPERPFGSVTRQMEYTDKNGKKKQSVLNIVNEEGNWDDWSKNLSSQMLSKQPPALAKEQLDLMFDRKKAEFDEINRLTNPAVKKKLLESYSDDIDSAAVHLKAAALPRQRTHVILPIPSLKENEVYAHNFKQGERVALVRYPHGGKFEIPEVIVNNRNPKAKALLGDAMDAIGINPKVAQRLSGADFDGDTVLVIPNDRGKVKTAPALKNLVNFDPAVEYKGFPGMPKMKEKTKQNEMGRVSNLITDMTIRGASNDELARAVRHSMVVIDAPKHNLNYRLSEKNNGIAALKEKYQGSSRAGASTLISRSSSDVRINERKPRPASEGGPVDPKTGKKVFVETGRTYVNKKGQTVFRKDKSTRGAETDDAFTLSSGMTIEKVYAQHANRLKALANDARKEALFVKQTPMSRTAKETYKKEVSSLNAKLNTALKNKPLERQAQLVGNGIVQAKRKANPDMDADELKKVRSQALEEGRRRTGALKKRIEITDLEWEAIQSGAVSNNVLTQILQNTDLDKIKQRATPKNAPAIAPALLSRAKSMAARGYTRAEIADVIGVSTTTLGKALKDTK